MTNQESKEICSSQVSYSHQCFYSSCLFLFSLNIYNSIKSATSSESVPKIGPTQIMTGVGEFSNIHMLRVSDIDDIDFESR
jgi:hypothetical protein